MSASTQASSIIVLALLFPVVACANDRDVEHAEADASALEAGERASVDAAVDPTQDTVRSADGTRIGFTRVGEGPVPVVIVHGALTASESWVPVATAMAEPCTCYVMDRWGRGGFCWKGRKPQTTFPLPPKRSSASCRTPER